MMIGLSAVLIHITALNCTVASFDSSEARNDGPIYTAHCVRLIQSAGAGQ